MVHPYMASQAAQQSCQISSEGNFSIDDVQPLLRQNLTELHAPEAWNQQMIHSKSKNISN
jgi:hypothetical protein